MDIPGPSNSLPNGEGEKVNEEVLCNRMDELATTENQKPTPIFNYDDTNGGLEPEAETDESFRDYEPEQKDTTSETTDVVEAPADPPKKRRGRPPKNKNEETTPAQPKKTTPKKASPQKRPRKPRKKKNADSDDDEAIYRLLDEEMSPTRKRKKKSVAEPPLEETVVPTQKKRRGRPAKSALMDPDMPLELATPKPAKARKPGKRLSRRGRAGNSSDDSDNDDELTRIPAKLTADMLRTIDVFHNGIASMTQEGYPNITPGLAYLPISEIYRVYKGKTDPGYEVITFPNESTIFT